MMRVEVFAPVDLKTLRHTCIGNVHPSMETHKYLLSLVFGKKITESKSLETYLCKWKPIKIK